MRKMMDNGSIELKKILDSFINMSLEGYEILYNSLPVEDSYSDNYIIGSEESISITFSENSGTTKFEYHKLYGPGRYSPIDFTNSKFFFTESRYTVAESICK